MFALAAFLLLQGAPPPDAASFIKKFDDLVRARKTAEAAKYYEAHAERFKDDPVLLKDAGRVEADYDDARGAPFRKTRLRIDFGAGAPGTKVSGPAKLVSQGLDMTPQGSTPGTLLHLPAGTSFTAGANVWIDIDVWFEGPEGTVFWLDVIGKRGGGVARSKLTVDALKPGGWRRRTLNFSAFALGAWPDQEKLMARDGDMLTQFGLIPPQKALGKLMLRSIHVYEEDKHESLKLPADAPDPGGLTRLHRAALGGDGKKVKELLGKGADPGAKTKGVGLTALLLAAGNGHAAVVDALLATATDPEDVSASLIAASRAASPKAVKALLAAKAEPSSHALQAACERDADRMKDQLDIIRQLVAAGADPKPAIETAEKSGFKEALDLLKGRR